MVEIAKPGPRDVCALCQKEIKPGTVFVVRRVLLPDGNNAYIPAHLWCNARAKGASASSLKMLSKVQNLEVN